MTSNRRFRIAVMPGDGIGPEVIDAALAVLEAATGDGAGFALDFEHLTAGAGAWRDTGTAMSEPTFERAKAADAVLLGAMGLPDVRYADGTEIAPQLDLRFRLGLYAGLRPVKALPGGARPLADPRGADIDLVIVRESTEGLFASRGKGVVEDDRVARDTMVITRETCERLFDASFRLARQRRARGGRGRSPAWTSRTCSPPWPSSAGSSTSARPGTRTSRRTTPAPPRPPRLRRAAGAKAG